MGTTVDSLEIQLQAQAGKANSAIDTLISKLGTLNTSLTKINGSGLSGVSNGVDKLSRSMQGLKNVGAADYTRLAKGIEKISNLDSGQISKAASAIVGFGKGLQSLNSVNVSKTSEQVANLAKGISQLGYKSSTKAIENIPLLAKSMRQLMSELSKAPKVSQNLIDMTNALAKLARTGASSGRAANALSGSLNTYTKSTHKASRGTKGLASALGKMYATYWLLFRFVGKIGDSITIASDLVEVQNVVDTVFGDMSSKVEEYAQNSIKQLGMSELSFKQYASRFQAMGSAMGIDTSSIGSANSFLNKATNGYVGLSNSMADVSLTLTQLTADMASFYNVSQKDVAEDLSAIFTGETRPLRTYGLDLTQATLAEWAMKNGLDANVKSMSQAEKTMLRYQYVLANTSAAQGDFARTSNTWANQIRILQEQIKKFASVIGTGFIAAFKPFVQTLNKVMAKVIDFTQNVLNALGQIFGWKFEISGGGIADDLGDVSGDLADSAGSSGDLSDNLGQAAKNAKKLHTLGIDELNIVEPDNGSTGSGGAGGSGGSGGAGSGEVGGLIASFNPNDEMLDAYKSSIKSLEQLGEYISVTLSNTLEKINWDSVYEKAKNFGTGLADFLNGLIKPRLFYNLGKTVANSINTAFQSANAFAVEFDWENLGESIAKSIKGFFENWDPEIAADTFSNFANGILESLTEFINTLQDDKTFETIGQKIVDFICGIEWGDLAWNLYKFGKALVKAIANLPNDFAKGALQSLVDKIFGEDAEVKVGDIALPPTSLSGLMLQLENIKEWVGETASSIGEQFRKGWDEAKKSWENGSGFFEGLWEGIKVVFSPVTEWFGEKFDKGYEGIKKAWSSIKSWFSQKWEDIKSPFKNVHPWFKTAFKNAYDAIKNIWKGLGDFFKEIAENAFKPIKTLVNGVIKGVNWVLEKVGSDTRVSEWSGIKFAKGSDGVPQNTLGIVNDQAGSTYKELIIPPSGKPFIPEGRNVMLPLEKGTKIMPANQTKAFISGTPHFKGGIGEFFENAWSSVKSFTGNVLDYLTNPGEIVKVAISKFANISNLFEPWSSVAGGIINKTFDGIVQYVSGIFDSIQPKYNPSAGVEQWRNIATKALKMTGQFSKSNLDLLLYQMQTESGGNPKAINKWDINAIKGTPSKGLMQVIDPTFRTYAYPGYDKDIYDPLSNILASIRYTLARYGSLSNGWKGHGYANGIGKITLADLIPKYSVGGFPEDGLFMANHNELVGTFSDGRTAVANNLDIQKGIEEAAYRGFSRANMENREQENLLRELIQAVRDGKRIVVDGRELVSITDSRRARNGYSFT